MDEPRFTLSQVAMAADIEANTLRSWLQRGHWSIDSARGDMAAESHGRAHLLTLRRALHIGAAVDLIRTGVEPRKAFRGALSFVDAFDPLAERGGHPRGENGLYIDGWTLLVVYPGYDRGVVIWVDDEKPRKGPTQPKDRKHERYPAVDALRALFFPPFDGLPQSAGAFTLLNRVDQRIRAGLPGAND